MAFLDGASRGPLRVPADGSILAFGVVLDGLYPPHDKEIEAEVMSIVQPDVSKKGPHGGQWLETEGA